MTRRALIVVDVQNDFCEGGALAVAGGAAVATAITEYLRAHADRYAAVVGTQDWHLDPGDHFADRPDYAESWPPHCRADSPGAAPHPGLDAALVEAWFTKGEHSAAYSGFEGATGPQTDRVGLARWLADRGIEAVDVVGIATDYCVRATALDAVRAGLATTLLAEFTAGVAADTTSAALAELAEAGVTVDTATR